MKGGEGVMSPAGMHLYILQILGPRIEISIIVLINSFQFSGASNLVVIYFVEFWAKIQIYHKRSLNYVRIRYTSHNSPYRGQVHPIKTRRVRAAPGPS